MANDIEQGDGMRAAWASRGGHLDFDPRGVSAELPDGLRARLRELIHLYAWTYDERQIELMRALYTEDATYGGSFWGEEVLKPIQGVDAIIEWQEYWMGTQTDQRRHFMANDFVSSFDGTRATVIVNVMITSADAERGAYVASGFYRFGFVNRNDEWRIEQIFAGFDSAF